MVPEHEITNYKRHRLKRSGRGTSAGMRRLTQFDSVRHSLTPIVWTGRKEHLPTRVQLRSCCRCSLQECNSPCKYGLEWPDWILSAISVDHWIIVHVEASITTLPVAVTNTLLQALHTSMKEGTRYWWRQAKMFPLVVFPCQTCNHTNAYSKYSFTVDWLAIGCEGVHSLDVIDVVKITDERLGTCG